MPPTPPRQSPRQSPRTPRRRRTPRQVPAIEHHAPVRTCLGCRRRRPSSELVRITRSDVGSSATPSTGFAVEVDGPSAGRGAWLCRSDSGPLADPVCFDAAIARRQFQRAWRCVLDRDDVEAIRAALRLDEHLTD